MKMLPATKLMVGYVVLMLMTAASLAVVSDNRLAAAGRRSHDDYSPKDSAAVRHACQTTTGGVLPATCEVCEQQPEFLTAQCCRWCLAQKTSYQRDNERETDRASDANKRGKYFLGKRPKYFLGK